MRFLAALFSNPGSGRPAICVGCRHPLQAAGLVPKPQPVAGLVSNDFRPSPAFHSFGSGFFFTPAEPLSEADMPGPDRPGRCCLPLFSLSGLRRRCYLWRVAVFALLCLQFARFAVWWCVSEILNKVQETRVSPSALLHPGSWVRA